MQLQKLTTRVKQQSRGALMVIIAVVQYEKPTQFRANAISEIVCS